MENAAEESWGKLVPTTTSSSRSEKSIEVRDSRFIPNHATFRPEYICSSLFLLPSKPGAKYNYNHQ